MRSKGKNSWKEVLIASIERAIKVKSLRYNLSDKTFYEVTSTFCPLCIKANNGGCSVCLLHTVLVRLGVGCLRLANYADIVGYEKILGAVQKTPREKLTSSYFRRIGIPRELHRIMDELKVIAERKIDHT